MQVVTRNRLQRTVGHVEQVSDVDGYIDMAGGNDVAGTERPRLFSVFSGQRSQLDVLLTDRRAAVHRRLDAGGHLDPGSQREQRTHAGGGDVDRLDLTHVGAAIGDDRG